MTSEAESEGWRAVRPAPGYREWTSIDHLIPKADWFWVTLQCECVPDCCGLAAYDFSADSVAWACGWGTNDPDGIIARHPSPGDVPALVVRLREAARAIREMNAEAVSADLFNDILTPSSYAGLLDDLAAKAVAPR